MASPSPNPRSQPNNSDEAAVECTGKAAERVKIAALLFQESRRRLSRTSLKPAFSASCGVHMGMFGTIAWNHLRRYWIGGSIYVENLYSRSFGTRHGGSGFVNSEVIDIFGFWQEFLTGGKIS